MCHHPFPWSQDAGCTVLDVIAAEALRMGYDRSDGVLLVWDLQLNQVSCVGVFSGTLRPYH